MTSKVLSLLEARTWNQKRARRYGSENLMAGQPGRSKPA